MPPRISTDFPRRPSGSQMRSVKKTAVQKLPPYITIVLETVYDYLLTFVASLLDQCLNTSTCLHHVLEHAYHIVFHCGITKEIRTNVFTKQDDVFDDPSDEFA